MAEAHEWGTLPQQPPPHGVWPHGQGVVLLQLPRSNLQRVAYSLQDNVLVRDYWWHLDQGYEEQRIRQPLLANVEEIAFRLITRGKETYDSWPLETENQAAPPVAVEVTLSIIGLGEIQRVFEVIDALG